MKFSAHVPPCRRGLWTSALVLALATAGCAGEGAAQDAPERIPVAPGPVKPLPDPEQESIPRPAIEKSTPAEIEALGLKKYGPHEHKGEYDTPHYKLTWVTMSWGDKPLTEEEKQQRLANAGVVHIEMWGKRLVTYHVIDLWSEADAKAWMKETAAKYLLQKDIGEHRWIKSSRAEASGWPSTRAAGGGGFVLALTDYLARDGSNTNVVVIACQEKFPAFEHAFWRWALENGEGRLKKLEKGYVFERSTRGIEDGALWATADGVLVSICTGGKYPTELIEAYLEKYPSILSADYKMDLERWGREEIELRLARMDEILADPKEAAKRKAYVYDEWIALRRFFVFPFDNAKCQTEEEHRALRKQLGDWWAASKDKLRWNPKIRGFEAGE